MNSNYCIHMFQVELYTMAFLIYREIWLSLQLDVIISISATLWVKRISLFRGYCDNVGYWNNSIHINNESIWSIDSDLFAALFGDMYTWNKQRRAKLLYKLTPSEALKNIFTKKLRWYCNKWWLFKIVMTKNQKRREENCSDETINTH
jgi:hypothetical protein